MKPPAEQRPFAPGARVFAELDGVLFPGTVLESHVTRLGSGFLWLSCRVRLDHFPCHAPYFVAARLRPLTPPAPAR